MINRTQLAILLVTGLGLLTHVSVLPMVLQTAHRGAWISVLAAGVALIGTTVALADASPERSVPWNIRIARRLGWPVAAGAQILMGLVLLTLVAFTLRDTVDFTHTLILPLTPAWIIASLCMGVAVYAAAAGLPTLAIIATILLPWIVLFGFMVGIGNLANKDYALLFPVSGHDLFGMGSGAVYVGAAFAEVLLAYLLVHNVSTPLGKRFFLIVGVVLIGITLGPLCGAIAEFGPYEAARLHFPAYEQWRLLRFGVSVEHVDVFSIYQWLAGAFVRIAFLLRLLDDGLATLFHVPMRWTLPTATVLAIVFASLPMSFADYQWLQLRFYPASLIVFCLLASLLLQSRIAGPRSAKAAAPT
ncbi:MAG: endospore germination permease [Firmicutes bacterium]|nr:endospore germination permease [Bacillota bacterium]